MDSGSLRGITGASGGCGYAAILAHEEALYGTVTVTELGSPAGRVCVECLIGKQKKPILFKVTEPSSIPVTVVYSWKKLPQHAGIQAQIPELA